MMSAKKTPSPSHSRPDEPSKGTFCSDLSKPFMSGSSEIFRALGGDPKDRACSQAADEVQGGLQFEDSLGYMVGQRPA